jgi:Domain of unknown function (DUF4123)
MNSSIGSLQLQPTSLERLRKFATGAYLYALLDAYDAPAVPAKVQELGKEKAVSLFIGEAEKKYWDLAPYLIQVDEPTLEWMLQTVWCAPCGVFVISKSGLETLRTHFRRFLMVQLPDGERWYFRYYDPRILKVYLENCRTDELDIFYGPVRGFGLMDPESDSILLMHIMGLERSELPSEVASGPIWQVRPEQFQALGEASRKDFEDRMVRHVCKLFPDPCKTLGEDGVRGLIRHGMARAAVYHLSREADLCKFIELMFAFGRDFDQNPKMPWASLTFLDDSIAEPSLRLARVLELANRLSGQKLAKGTVPE